MIVPLSVIFSDLDFENWLRGILLVPYFQTSYSRYQICLEWQIVFGLRGRVDVLYNDIDRFPWISLVEIDVPYEVNILEDLRRLKSAGEYLFRRQGLRGVNFGEDAEGERGHTG